jgi:hypothetical protein
MAEESTIQVGDRVIGLDMPGIFTVVGRRGRFVEIENDRGLRRVVHEVALRRVNGTPPGPKEG